MSSTKTHLIQFRSQSAVSLLKDNGPVTIYYAEKNTIFVDVKACHNTLSVHKMRFLSLLCSIYEKCTRIRYLKVDKLRRPLLFYLAGVKIP